MTRFVTQAAPTLEKDAMRNEMAELMGKRYFVGVQFHPEFRSSPFQPSPPFLGLVAAASRQLDRVLTKMGENGSNGAK